MLTAHRMSLLASICARRRPPSCTALPRLQWTGASSHEGLLHLFVHGQHHVAARRSHQPVLQTFARSRRISKQRDSQHVGSSQAQQEQVARKHLGTSTQSPTLQRAFSAKKELANGVRRRCVSIRFPLVALVYPWLTQTSNRAAESASDSTPASRPTAIIFCLRKTISGQYYSVC